MWRNAGIKIIISGTLNWSSVGILGILNFFVLFCFVVFFPLCRLACGIIARSAGLFQNPKQICACDGVTLWEERDRPIAGKGRSKNNLETPAAHLWTSQTSGHWWEFEQGGQKASRREMQIVFLGGARVLTRGRQSPEDYCTDDQTAMNGLNFVKMLFVIKSNALCSCCLMFFWAF